MGYNLLQSPPPNRHGDGDRVASPEKHYLFTTQGTWHITSSHMRLIGCDRLTHITLLQSVWFLATHVQAVGGHPLHWGAASSGSSATHVQAVGGHPLHWGAASSGSSATHVQAVGGHPLQWGAATSGSSHRWSVTLS